MAGEQNIKRTCAIPAGMQGRGLSDQRLLRVIRGHFVAPESRVRQDPHRACARKHFAACSGACHGLFAGPLQ